MIVEVADKPMHRQSNPMCPCGNRGTHWIGSVPSCDDCMSKDKVYQAGLRKWNAFHLQERLDLGEVVSVSGLEVEHVQTHREDGK